MREIARLLSLLLMAWALPAADLGPDLLAAARKGQTSRVEALLARGAPIEAADKDGRTPLMAAAQHGHAGTVKLLLDKGANPGARDHQGWTAYGLAAFSSSGARGEVLKALPQPGILKVSLDVRWVRENLASSCFLTPAQLLDLISGIKPGALVAAALRDFAASNGKGLMEFVGDASGDSTLYLKVRPGASCLQQQSTDNLSLMIEARMVRTRNQAEMLERTFGGGLKGLHARAVSSPSQYEPVLSEWVKSHAGTIYWAAVEAWLRSQ
jgi:hypothetical protein